MDASSFRFFWLSSELFWCLPLLSVFIVHPLLFSPQAHAFVFRSVIRKSINQVQDPSAITFYVFHCCLLPVGFARVSIRTKTDEGWLRLRDEYEEPARGGRNPAPPEAHPVFFDPIFKKSRGRLLCCQVLRKIWWIWFNFLWPLLALDAGWLFRIYVIFVWVSTTKSKSDSMKLTQFFAILREKWLQWPQPYRVVDLFPPNSANMLHIS